MCEKKMETGMNKKGSSNTLKTIRTDSQNFKVITI